jgi:hypothetical protein
VTSENSALRTARAVAGFLAGLALGALWTGAGAAADDTFSATYSISIAGIPIGKAAAESRFNGSRYTLTINGFTSGVSRLVSDATANLASNGSIYGSRVLPASYRLDTVDGGHVSSIEIRMNGGTVTNVTAVPEMRESPDRVPLNGKDKQNVVDPLSALILPAPGVGKMTAEEACDRTVRIFDGWQRFDVRLSFKRQREIKGPDGAYSGPVYVCGARFIPVAGHVPKRVKSLANNKSIEIWLAPVSDMSLLVPYSIQLNIPIGTLVVRANYLKFGPPSERAAAE